jgi:hypothetical protein
MAPRSLNLFDFHRKFYKLPWLAFGRYKLVGQSVEMTLHPAPPEEFPEDDPGPTLKHLDHGWIKLYLKTLLMLVSKRGVYYYDRINPSPH